MKEKTKSIRKKSDVNVVGNKYCLTQNKKCQRKNVNAILTFNANGITLIALIITIIVMLILVGVTVNVAINGGLFSMAKSAVRKTKEEMNKEQRVTAIVNAETNNQTWTYTTKDKKQVPIPAGFAPTQIEGEDTVEDGLVIVDGEGNEFVWIPVNYELEEGETKNETTGLYPSFLKVFYRSNWDVDTDNGGKRGSDLTNDNNYTEPYTDGYTGEDTEYNEMMKSVQDNKGFYIGRYESGTETVRNTSAGDTKMVVKRNMYPYNFVAWGMAMNNIDDSINKSGHGAVYICKHFYDNKDVGVVPTLCYGIQWDAMINFIKSADKNIISSTKWGNYRNNNWTITNQSAKYSTNRGNIWNSISDEQDKQKNKGNEDSVILLTTGAHDDFAAKNIYDVAGNCFEWTMEAYSSNNRVLRGR